MLSVLGHAWHGHLDRCGMFGGEGRLRRRSERWKGRGRSRSRRPGLGASKWARAHWELALYRTTSDDAIVCAGYARWGDGAWGAVASARRSSGTATHEPSSHRGSPCRATPLLRANAVIVPRGQSSGGDSRDGMGVSGSRRRMVVDYLLGSSTQTSERSSGGTSASPRRPLPGRVRRPARRSGRSTEDPSSSTSRGSPTTNTGRNTGGCSFEPSAVGWRRLNPCSCS